MLPTHPLHTGVDNIIGAPSLTQSAPLLLKRRFATGPQVSFSLEFEASFFAGPPRIFGSLWPTAGSSVVQVGRARVAAVHQRSSTSHRIR